MIKVSVEPSRIVAGTRMRLGISFANIGQGACSSLGFKLVVPPGILLLDGQTKVEVPSILAGEIYTHEVVVEAANAGEYVLRSRNFSYRDEYEVPQYPGDLRWTLSVSPEASPRRTSPRPVPAPAVRVEDGPGRLKTGSWEKFKILVRNTADVPLDNVAVEVSGPLRTNGRQPRIGRLQPGVTARFAFDVLADQDGQVPVAARTTFTYPDGLGSILRAAQDDDLEVTAVRAPAPDHGSTYVNYGTGMVVSHGDAHLGSIQHGTTSGNHGNGTAARHADAHVDSVLYLTASPTDPDMEWLPLQSNLEMRKVQERLRRSALRKRYRIEVCPAARLEDVSQALVDYRPQIVHFSGHGDSDGSVLLQNDAGGAELVKPEGLARLFALHRSTVRCVMVNACHSERLARAMADNIDYVIGMRCEIGDEAAVQFSVGFYIGLFAGEKVPDAFERGIAHVQGPEATSPEYRTPLLRPER